jgi:hypothetical protein
VYVAYQGSRLFAYSVLGALMGLLGLAPLSLVKQSALSYLPWAMVVFFVLIALGVERRFKKPLALVRLGWKSVAYSKGRSVVTTAMMMGLATPLLPCGPLYLMAALSGLTGSPIRGMEFMLAFGLGTLPLLWITQLFLSHLRGKLQPVWLVRVQRLLALFAALVISWRLRGTLGLGGDTSSEWICF